MKDIWEKYIEKIGELAKIIRTSTLKECIEIGEGMKKNQPVGNTLAVLVAVAVIEDYQEQLKKLL